LVNAGTPNDIVFNLPTGDGNNNATLGDNGVADGISQIAGTGFETTNFANPTGSLTINRGTAGDTLTLNALPDFNASLTLGSVGGEFAAVTFNNPLTLAAGKNLSVNASGTISLPNAASDIATSGTGAVSLTTARNISLAAGSSITTVDGGITLSANAAGTTA